LAFNIRGHGETRHLTLKGQGRASIYLGPNILKTDGDRDLGPMDHQ